jgi:MFS family permease
VSIGIVFALINGLYSSYAFLYLKNKLEGAGGLSGSILDNLLFIIIGAMFFEFFAEPITGDWADTYGRRRVVVASFLGLTLAMLAYWSISAHMVASFDSAMELRIIVVLSLLAQFLFAISSALYTGALDAWFVDELRGSGGPHGADLLPLFSAQRRWFGVFMVTGGVLSLWIARAAFQGGAQPADTSGLAAFTALPWLGAAVLTALTALWVSVRLIESRALPHSDEPSFQRIWRRLKRTLSSRELRNALLISSVLYTCWICFMYLLPVLLTEKQVVSEAGLLRLVLKDYYWYYLAMGTSRFIGPYLSSRVRLGGNQVVQFRSWGVLNCGALAVAGVALLLRTQGSDGTPGAVNAFLVPFALVLFWITKVAEEAFKPVRSTYLNYLVVDSGDRAFVLSLATPFGAIIILVGISLLIVAQRFFAFLDEVRFSVPLLFAILGSLGLALTINLARKNRVR